MNLIGFLGLIISEKAKTLGLGSFDLKLYRAQNLDISTQQQLELEFPVLLSFSSDEESELNGK